MTTYLRKILLAVLAGMIMLSACSITSLQPSLTPPAVPTRSTVAIPTQSALQTPTQPAGASGIYPPPFASYHEISASLPPTFNGGGYSLPIDLNQVQNLAGFELTDAQRALLTQNGFAVSAPVAGEYREFYQIYERWRYSDNPLFITTDSVFHIYHLLFDKMLRDLETAHFIVDLKSLSSAMLAASYGQYLALTGTSLEEPARRNVAYFAVATQLLGLPDPVPPEVVDLVIAELALINGAAGFSLSPIWDRPDLPVDQKLMEDYSQYIHAVTIPAAKNLSSTSRL